MDASVRVRCALAHPYDTLENLRSILMGCLFAFKYKGLLFVGLDEPEDEETSVQREILLGTLSWLRESDAGAKLGSRVVVYYRDPSDEKYAEAAKRLVWMKRAQVCVQKGDPGRQATSKYGYVVALPAEGAQGCGTVSESSLARPCDELLIYLAEDMGLLKGAARPELMAAVDDGEYRITHTVVRRELLPMEQATAQVAAALGRPAPQCVVLPTLVYEGSLGMLGRKRGGHLAELREAGYLPEAVAGFLITVGWFTGAHPERLSWKALAAHFSIEKLCAHRVRVPERQLYRFGRQAMRNASIRDIDRRLRPLLVRRYGRWNYSEETAHSPERWFEILICALKEEAATISEMVDMSSPFLTERVSYETVDVGKWLRDPCAPSVFRRCLQTLSDEAVSTPEAAKAFFREQRHFFRERQGLRGMRVMFPLRAALTGSMVGPCLGVVATLLGAGRCRERLQRALNWGGNVIARKDEKSGHLESRG